MFKKMIYGVIMVFLVMTAVLADPYDLSGVKSSKKVINVIQTDILKWINNKEIVKAVLEANKKNKNRTVDEIKALDQKWRSGDSTFINSILNNNASKYLKGIQKKSGGVFAEIFAMDYQGCNVGQSSKTSDYWQGDEDKFIKSYNNGNGAIFVDSVEFDESAQAYLVQVSLPIVDPKTKNVIGAITIGIDMDQL